MAVTRPDLKCTLVALLSAWVTMVFGTSALIILLVAPGWREGSDDDRSSDVGAVWRHADEMGPAVKLLLIALFALMALLGQRATLHTLWQRCVLAGCLGAVAMLLTLMLLPASLSRGFGVGLTGARLDAGVLPTYLLGGALGGVAFVLSLARCHARR